LAGAGAAMAGGVGDFMVASTGEVLGETLSSQHRTSKGLHLGDGCALGVAS